METKTDTPSVTTTPIPWTQRGRIGLTKALAKTVKEVLSKPGDFFNRLSLSNSLLEPFSFYFILTSTITILSYVHTTLLRGKPLMPASPLLIFFPFAMMLIIISMGIFLTTLCVHLSVIILRGTPNYRSTFHVLCYASSATIFLIIPWVGGLISTIWALVTGIIGLKRFHSLGTFRSFLAYCCLPLFAAIVGITLILLITLLPHNLRTNLNFKETKIKDSITSLIVAMQNVHLQKKEAKPQMLVINTMRLQQVATLQPVASKAKTPVKRMLSNNLVKPRFLLNGIFASDESASYALINNQIAKVGDRIDGAVVKRINQDSVELESGSKNIVLTPESK